MAVMLLGSTWTACATDAGDSAPPAEDVAPTQVIASLKTRDGAKVTFINESAPGEAPSIGIEIASSTATPWTDALLAQAPSALELYLAASPGHRAPLALVTDHERLAASLGLPDPAPRALVVASADTETSGFFDCEDSASWQTSFQSWAPVLDGEFTGIDEHGRTTGYVGYANKFYFDVCRPNDIVAGLVPYFTGVQRRTNSGAAWITINGNTEALDHQARRWRYIHNSPLCSSFQYQLLVVGTSSNTYHRGARWSDEFPCQIGL